jgi:predicted transcriptional regulator
MTIVAASALCAAPQSVQAAPLTLGRVFADAAVPMQLIMVLLLAAPAAPVVVGVLKQPSGSARDLIDEVQASSAWGEATVKTLLGRLMRKGAIRSERNEGRQRYTAALSREAYVDAEVDALLDRLFEGRPERLASLLAERASRAG